MRWGNRNTNRKIHSRNFSLKYLFPLWMICVEGAEEIWFPSLGARILLFQGLNVPLRGTAGQASHSQQHSSQRLRSVTFFLPIDLRIILKWKIYPPSWNWGHWYSGKGTVPLRLSCSYLSNFVKWLIGKWSQGSFLGGVSSESNHAMCAHLNLYL